jgi:phage tail-like protein
MKRIFLISFLIICTSELQAQNTWPNPKFSYLVTIGGIEFSFEEVIGLSTETQVIEYRGGSSPVYSTVKMPGIQKFGNVTFKKGIAKNDLTSLLAKAKAKAMKRETIIIKLMDENGESTFTWTLTNAFIAKFGSTDKFSIDTIEVAHEGLTVSR